MVAGSPSAPPKRIAGRYAVRALLGQGGFGQVYEAYDELTDREVALKLIRKDDATSPLDSKSRHTRETSSHHSSRSSPRTFRASRRTVTRSSFGHTPASTTSEVAQAFRDEFRLLTQLHHPNLAGVHDFGRCPEIDALFFTQDLVRGQTLSDFLKGASRETIVEIFVQLARALDYIHALGLVHDDIKPSNVLVSPGDEDQQRPQAKLIDFGLAHILRGEGATIRAEAQDDSEGIVVLGTPGYAAPEKVRGQPPDARSDIYSLAATLYAAIRGQRAFPGKSFKEVLRAQRDWRPELAGALLPASGEVVADLVGRMLQPDPSKRPQSARAIVLELLRREAGHLPQRGPNAEDRKEFARLLVEQLPFVDRAGYLELLLDKANTVLLRAEQPAEASASRSGARSHLIRTVLIEAPEGMGKRRLMAELRREIQLGDGLFVEASCWGTDPSALGPFAPLVVQLAAALGESSAANQSFPQIVALARGEDVPTTVAQQLMEYLIAASRERPYVLHLSALSHAPEAVRLQFDQLCRAVDHNEAPIMVCATSEPHTKVTPLFQSLHREQLAEAWRLRPFQSREMYDLLRATVGETPILPELSNMLDKLTGGHPLSVRETLRALIEENVLSRDADSWTLRGASAATEVLHKSLTQRSEARLDALGVSAWEVVSVLYLLEAPIAEEMLSELTELRRRRFVRTLERLEGEGLIARAAVGNASMIQLAHDSVRQAVHHRYGDSLNETRLDLAARIDELGIDDPQFVYLRARLLDDASEGTESCADLKRAAQVLFAASQPQLGARVLDRLIRRLREHGGVAALPDLLAAKVDLLEQAAGALEDPRKELQHYHIGIFIAELLGDHRAEAKFWLGLADRFVHDTSEDATLALERLDAATRAATLAKDDHLVL
ncbi:MAG TPA: hypothetical protein ENK57_24270, partial [Polyangiaceae bacterium]|nr:hypothetical protein [Polyangiaceae bacterium]